MDDRLDVSYISCKGGKAVNQDYCRHTKVGDTWCLALADGLGGHGHGELASRLAGDQLIECFGRNPRPDAGTIDDHFRIAANCLSEYIRQNPDYRKMKTTLSAVYTDLRHTVCAHAGDTRIYVFAGGRILYQSVDHSVPQRLVLSGELAQQAVRGHPQRNQLLSAMGEGPPAMVTVEALPQPLAPGTGILLCSDGFWELILEEEMQALLKASATAEVWVKAMATKIGNRQGVNSDNYSCMAAIVRD